MQSEAILPTVNQHAAFDLPTGSGVLRVLLCAEAVEKVSFSISCCSHCASPTVGAT